jgi:hypothetical protein
MDKMEQWMGWRWNVKVEPGGKEKRYARYGFQERQNWNEWKNMYKMWKWSVDQVVLEKAKW